MESNLLQEAADEIFKGLDDDYYSDSNMANFEEAGSNVNELMREHTEASGPVNETTRSYAESASVNGMMRDDADENSVNASRRIDANNDESQEQEDSINGKALSDDELKHLHDINKQFAHVVAGGKHKVISKVPCPQIGYELTLESLPDFKNRFLTEDKIAGMNAGDAWLRWRGKFFKPDGLAYYPEPDKCPVTVYNLFEGFGIEPTEGDIDIYLKHLSEVICDGDEKAFQFLIGWLAHLVQCPMEKPGVAIVLKSVEGTGKGTFFEPLKRMLGAHALQVNGAYQITGRFNSALANQQLVFADEVNLTEHKTADKLKGLITEPRVSLERKGIDSVHMPSYTRFVFASNHEQVLRAGGRERRFLVLEPSSKYAQQRSYFTPLWEWINDGGASYLLDYLLKYDLTGFDPRRAPITQALLEEKLTNLSPVQQFMMAELSKEEPFDRAVRLSTSDMVNRCSIWMDCNGYTMELPRVRSMVGKLIHRMGIDRKGKHGRNALYELPERSCMQSSFARLLGHDREEIFD